MDLFQDITPNTTLLTPNRRLSASIFKAYTQFQTTQGKTCWQAPDIIPLYPSWLEQLWKNYTAQVLKEHDKLLTTHQEQILWEKILREAPENETLLQVSETAKLAKSAWQTLKRWRVTIQDPHLKLTEDSRAFLNWATQFQKECQKNHWLDQNSLADILADRIRNALIIAPERILLIGFTDIAPQYHNLLNVCEQMGSQIIFQETPSKNQTANYIGLTDTESELKVMARWSKSLLDKSDSIACIIPSLDTLRDTAVQIFSDVFDDRQFNISAGKNLISYPIIYDALQLLKLNHATISINILTSLLRSPFVGEAESERYKRAMFENRLRQLNISTLSLAQLINPDIKYNLIESCPGLATRIQAFQCILASLQQKKLMIREWVSIFIKLLSALGWPGERSLNSHEYQIVKNSWLPLLNEFTSLDTILGPKDYFDALHYLICLCVNTFFQPESPDAPVQILGLLEAAGLSFDYMWIMGLDDTSWPPRPKPNPFIPLRLQKSLNMPNASADRELVYCKELTQQFQSNANHVIFSYPMQRDDAELRPSTLLINFPKIESNNIVLSAFISPAEKLYQNKQWDFLSDDMAPAISQQEEIHGGVRIFKNQAECPFKAFAEIRLHARKIEENEMGLRKLDRGNVIHRALEFIWREIKDSKTLQLKSDEELKEIIHQHADHALTEVTKQNRMINARYLSLELQRVEKLIWDWLQVEKFRPPFSVVALEQEITATIGNITAQFRVDRIDELTEENTATKQLIIDYKTGKETDKKGWFGERLNQPQLPIYCIINPEVTLGIAFAKVNPTKIEIIGASKTPLKMQAIYPIADIKQADATLWSEQIKIWQTNLVKLGNDFYQGKATVDPKDSNQTCRLCGLQPLCRVHELKTMDEEYDNET